jgi:hypothetical protein
MTEAAVRNGVQLVVGHSHSFDLPVLRTRELLESGAFGRVRMITAVNFTDFLYRPRRPEELDTAQGGGAVFNPVFDPVQVEAIRQVGDWLKLNGESIYGTRGGPYMPTPRYTATRKGNVVYLHILKWDGDTCKLPPLGAEIAASSLLTGGNADVSNLPDGLTVTVKAAERKDPDTVVKLELKGDAMALQPIKPDPADQPPGKEKK